MIARYFTHLDAKANTQQLWNRRLPPPQQAIVKFGASPIAISSHEGNGWVGAADDVPRIDDGYANAV